jgi:hypothetical protein
MEVDFYKNWTKNMENGGRLTTYSVYGFVEEIEDILIDSHESRAHESGPHMPKAVNSPHKPKDAPTVDWAAATKAAAKGTASVGKNVFSFLSGSQEPKWRSEIQKMFGDAQDLIQKRQKMQADKMIGLRNAELERWKKVLQDGKATV